MVVPYVQMRVRMGHMGVGIKQVGVGIGHIIDNRRYLQICCCNIQLSANERST